MRKKLGLFNKESNDVSLIEDLLKVKFLHYKISYTDMLLDHVKV